MKACKDKTAKNSRNVELWDLSKSDQYLVKNFAVKSYEATAGCNRGIGVNNPRGLTLNRPQRHAVNINKIDLPKISFIHASGCRRNH